MTTFKIGDLVRLTPERRERLNHPLKGQILSDVGRVCKVDNRSGWTSYCVEGLFKEVQRNWWYEPSLQKANLKKFNLEDYL